MRQRSTPKGDRPGLDPRILPLRKGVAVGGIRRPLPEGPPTLQSRKGILPLVDDPGTNELRFGRTVQSMRSFPLSAEDIGRVPDRCPRCDRSWLVWRQGFEQALGSFSCPACGLSRVADPPRSRLFPD